MKSMILTIDQEHTILHFHQLLRFNILKEDIYGMKLEYVVKIHREFQDILRTIKNLEDRQLSFMEMDPYYNSFYFGIIKGFAERDFINEKVTFSVSKTIINELVLYFVFAEYSEKVQGYINLLQEKEKISIEAVNVLREISKTVLNEPSSKVAAKKSLEMVSNLFHAKASIFRLYSRGKADVYGSYGLPYGYLGRNAQIITDKIPIYKEVVTEKKHFISDNPETDLGRLYSEIQEIIDVNMVVAVPTLKKGKVIAVLTLFFEKSYQVVKESMDILENVVNEFDLLIEKNEYYAEILTTTEKLKKLSLDIVTSLSDAIETRDSYTNGHSKRVAIYSVEIARNMGWDDYDLERLRIAGILHDIGKVGIPDAILLKPTPLNKYEYEIMKLHPELSANIVSKIENFQEMVSWIRYHHEFYNGSGYPFGLKGNEIPLAARIIAVADAYDAMTSDRPYRKSMKMEQVTEIFNEAAGTQWDKDVVNIALKYLEVLPKELQYGYNIPEKLDEFRRTIFNVSLLSGLYLYEVIYDELEKYLEQKKLFTIAIISLKDTIDKFTNSNKKKFISIMIDLCKTELHYPIMVSRFNYYQLIIFAPQINKKFLRSIITKVQIKFFEDTDIYFTSNILTSPDDSTNINEILDTLQNFNHEEINDLAAKDKNKFK